MTTPISANGVSGILLRGVNGTYLFRVYSPDGEFIDYKVCHADLSVTINDADAFFYCAGHNAKIDHSPATLGILEIK